MHLGRFFNGSVNSLPDVNGAIFLKENVGSYTALRTVKNGTHIVDWAKHIQRLKDSIRITNPSANTCSNLEINCLELIKRVILECECKMATDFKIIILVTQKSQSYTIYAMVDVFVDFESTSIGQVGIFGNPRKNPNAKDSSWLNDRLYIEQMKSSNMTEMILRDVAGNLYEGLVSNFFVISQDLDGIPVVLTAPLEDILIGTILESIVEICKFNEIRLRYEYPNILDCSRWKGAFITNAYRWVHGIECIDFLTPWYFYL